MIRFLSSNKVSKVDILPISAHCSLIYGSHSLQLIKFGGELCLFSFIFSILGNTFHEIRVHEREEEKRK